MLYSLHDAAVLLTGSARDFIDRHGPLLGGRSEHGRTLPDRRMKTMAQAATASKTRTTQTGPSAFELPKFDIPNFEMPKLEIPAAFREIAEKSVSQAKEGYEKMKTAAEEAT